MLLRDPLSLATTTEAAFLAAAVSTQVLPDSVETSQIQKHHQQSFIRWCTYCIMAAATASVIVALVAMLVEASIICYFAFVFPLVIAPALIIQRRRINRLPTLIQEINLCRVLTNRFMVQNERLQREQHRLTGLVQRLQASQSQLEQVAQQSGLQIEDLQALCRAYGETLRQMQALHQAQEVQALLQAILSADDNNDGYVSEHDLEHLALRLRIFNFHSSCPVDDGLLRRAFCLSKGASSVSTTTLFRQTQQLLEEERHRAIAEYDDDDDGLWDCGYQQCAE